jgi:hypothetical protein
MDEFVIYHVPREENPKANALAQQASAYNVQKRNFQERKPMFSEAEGFILEESVQPPPPAGQTGYPSQTAPLGRSDRPSWGNPTSATVSSKIAKDEVGDWRTPLIKYLQDPKSISDRKVRRWALKFILCNDELYRQTSDDLLLGCLGRDHARLAMAVVHERICGTHQSASKMKWLLRRACFY